MIVENRLTPLTVQQATRALYDAYTRVTGGPPNARILVRSESTPQTHCRRGAVYRRAVIARDSAKSYDGSDSSYSLALRGNIL